MSRRKFDDLPEDLQIELIKKYGLQSIPENMQNLYKRNLPKISLKTISKDKLKSAKDTLKKVQQVCDYQSFDKKSHENQIKKLTTLYKGYLFVAFAELNKKPYTSFIGKGKMYLFENTLVELRNFCKNEAELQKFYCKLIKCVDFDRGTKINNPIIRMIRTISGCFMIEGLNKNFINFILNLVPKKERNDFLKDLKTSPDSYNYIETFMTIYTDKLTNSEIQDLFCNIMKFIKFKNDDSYTENAQYLLEYFVFMNDSDSTSIKKELFENVLLDTVRNNRREICRFLNEVYQETITFY